MPPSANPRSCSRGCGRRNYEPVAAFGKIRAGAASRAGGRERLPAPPEAPRPQGVAGRVAAVFGGALSRPVRPPEVLLVISPHASDLADQFRCEPARLTSRPSRGFPVRPVVSPSRGFPLRKVLSTSL